jgi:hypothetical protein
LKRQVAASFTSVLWGLLTYMGYRVVSSVSEQHAPGYPNPSQWRYYLYFPLTMLVLSIALLLWGRRMPVAVFGTIWFLHLVIVLPFLFAYTGGI